MYDLTALQTRVATNRADIIALQDTSTQYWQHHYAMSREIRGLEAAVAALRASVADVIATQQQQMSTEREAPRTNNHDATVTTDHDMLRLAEIACDALEFIDGVRVSHSIDGKTITINVMRCDVHL